MSSVNPSVFAFSPSLSNYFFSDSSLFPHSILTTMSFIFSSELSGIVSVPISYLRESEILWKALQKENLQFSTSTILSILTAMPSV